MVSLFEILVNLVHLERVEGIVFRKMETLKSLNRGKHIDGWQKCFAVLNPNTTAFHALDIVSHTEAKRLVQINSYCNLGIS